MYSRYSPGTAEEFIPAAGGMQPLNNRARHEDERGRERERRSPLAGLFGGGKNPLGGFIKGLRRRDGGELDLGDIVLLLILFLLFMEDDSNDFIIIIVAILILGI